MQIRLSRPGADPLTQRSPRVVAARRLLRRRHRDAEGLFLAEGPQTVREAVASGTVLELFGTVDAYGRRRDLVAEAYDLGASVWPVTEAALAALADTVSPQGVVAVCRHLHRSDVTEVLSPQTRLVVVLAGVADPGNAGTILRTADAAGVEAVVFPEGNVDPYNGKCVRSSAGSLFHVDLVRGGHPAQAVQALKSAGLSIFAADAHGSENLDGQADAGALAGPTAWVFGSEAHGLPAELADLADARVRVPMYGRAESLNLAAAAAVCLYASARAHSRGDSR
jgi:TrmH family RNA methyltransferase